MRIKIFLAIVVTLSLILSGCADQPTSPQLVQEKLALILTQSALQAAQPTPTQQPGLLLPTETPQPPPSAPVTGVSAPGEPKPDARINITAIQQIGPGQAIVNFDAIGEFPSGFNVVWTKELKRPVSPQDDGAYESDPYSRAAMFSGEPGYVYIVRVCRYIGDGCDVYSDPAFFNFRRYAPTPTPNRTATARALNPVVSGGGGGGGGSGGTSATAAPKFAIISITDAGGLKARMVWTSDTDPARGFRIYYSTSNKEPKEGSDSYFSIADDDERQAYVDGKAGTTYYYRVCKFTGSGCSEYTAAFSHTYPGTAAKPPPTKVPATPDPTTILIATIEDVEGGVASITWAASGDFPQGFKVMYSATKTNPTLDDTVVTVSDGTERSAVVEGEPSEKYYFKVCKFDGSKCVMTSPAYDFTFAPIAENTAFVLSNDTTITDPGRVVLTWTALVDPPANLVVLWTSYPGTPVYPDHEQAMITGTEITYDTTLDPGGDYNFRLCKSTGDYCTEYSTVLRVVAPASP